MNSITVGQDLNYVDYTDLLAKILLVLQKPNQEIFKKSNNGKHLQVDIDNIASEVANLQIENPLGASANSVRTATVNISPGSEDKFRTQIRTIKDCVNKLLKSSLENSESIEDFVNKLITDLSTFQGKTSNLDFTYPFSSYENLQKQRLTFNKKTPKNRELLKVHKLTISVQKTRDFDAELRKGLENYMKVKFAGASSAEKEDLEYVLEDLEKDKKSDINTLRDIVNTETLGKLKKQAQINYLEFLRENINTKTSKLNAEGAIYLEDLIRRLKLIEEYINDINKSDGDYLVNYAGASVNYRDAFSRGEAFNMLPIIPIVDGSLGQTKDENREQIQFIFGLKLKFDGKVHTDGGKNVFDYRLNILNPDSEEHKAALADSSQRESFAAKVLRIAFLYYFLFASRQNPKESNYNPNDELVYDPIAGFEQQVIPIFRGSDDAAKQDLLRKILKGFTKFNTQIKINRLKGVLQNILKRKISFPTRDYPVHISVKNGLIEEDMHNIFDNNTFFKSVLRGNPKQVLKYISLGKANTQTNSFCTLAANITITDIHFYDTDDRETFSMEYDLSAIYALPVIFAPLQDKRCLEIYNKRFQKRHLLLFPYRLEDKKLESHQAFVYKFTYALLAYICLKLLLDNQKQLFIPILRLHLKNKEDDAPIEKFIVSLSSVLSHLFNETHRANDQGIDISDFQGKSKFKIPNVMSSLYSVLPKKFRLNTSSQSPQLDKLAIIIVSSRESDSKWGSSQKISNLMGEIIGVQMKNGTVKFQLPKTFSENYDHQQMFTEPSTIIDNVTKLYEQGYKHIIYIAKAPYTSTLHMTQTEEDDGLFFMSKNVIRSLKAQREDIKIYPMFFDKYYAVMLEPNAATSLYIQDTTELTTLVEDPSKQSVVFFNLFNGMIVGKQEERHYRGVISYATLLNIYKDILDDEDIRKGLIYNGSLKKDILQYLTFFHFSRYQKADKKIHIKLDPYENLIGDKSVGKLSLFNQMRGKSEFNSLAFLTLVRNVLNAE
ncbi:hypothetical protein [uncultured Nostoc sp.]|uniref:hypothetical protein n=1 Tax=uncultured Nostoc sp. TaxID=340711 RepID=UPI0035C9ED2C